MTGPRKPRLTSPGSGGNGRPGGRTRDRRTAAATVALVALLLGGCGLPGRTEPRYLGPAATANATPDRVEQPPTREGAATASDLVTRFLASSVGGNGAGADPEEARTETQKRMRTFLTQSGSTRWLPGQKLQVVKVARISEELGKEAGTWTVSVEGQLIGTLDERGVLNQEPTQDRGQPSVWNFKVVSVGGPLMIEDAPKDTMLLSDWALDEWYLQQPIYFWETGVDSRKKLVPDLRYMSKLLLRAQRVAQVLSWLARPSDLVQPVAEGLAADVDIKDIPVVTRDAVTINLGFKAIGKEDELRRAANQIRWSLEAHPRVTLTIENKERGIHSDGFEGDNAAVEAGAEISPERFCIVDGVARPVDLSSGSTPTIFAQGGDNTWVVSAAINRSKTHAALVRQPDPRGKQTLYVSAADAATTNPSKYLPVGVSGAKLTRPVWIERPAQLFLVSDGMALWAVTPPTASAPARVEKVSGPQGDAPTSGISSLAVAPDGRRIAFISNGAVNVASLLFDNGKLTGLGTYRKVYTSLGENRAVGWLTETSLAVGGTRNPAALAGDAYSLVSITVDSTAEKPLPERDRNATAQSVITQMSVRIASPSGQQGGVLIMFESNGVAHNVYSQDIGPLQLIGPQPSASPTGPQQLPPAKAPFYAD
ncbi:hypothetical protein Drose_32935 [Dactylosporangium roseum]|uniref:GerMN domain-containing protein n=1 Tax=Dactylosporangium roseum TaxID=47989 RepID=A0ABY5Z1E6_9ACTN|nr:LpqB family beta-propeller domain-containing protein [Dactylosporangium roseum]UWZ35846.1 hypothetical protein Drose_32935 [Dactylosporangium roseum]